MKTITRKQIGVIYAAFKSGRLDWNKEIITKLYDEIADHEFAIESKEYQILVVRVIPELFTRDAAFSNAELLELIEKAVA